MVLSKNCYGVAFYESALKLCFLRKLMDGVVESTSLLGTRMLGAFGSDQECTLLVRECSELEEWYGISFT